MANPVNNNQLPPPAQQGGGGGAGGTPAGVGGTNSTLQSADQGWCGGCCVSLSKLPCGLGWIIGYFASWLGYNVNEPAQQQQQPLPVQTPDQRDAAVRLQIVAAFTNGAQTVEQITLLKASFNTIGKLDTKLETLQAMQSIVSDQYLPHQTLKEFFLLLPNAIVQHIYQRIFERQFMNGRVVPRNTVPQSGQALFEANPKQDLVREGVIAYRASLVTEEDQQKESLIMGFFAPNIAYPGTQVVQSAVDKFKELSSDKVKLQVLAKLFGNHYITDADLFKFVEALPDQRKQALYDALNQFRRRETLRWQGVKLAAIRGSAPNSPDRAAAVNMPRWDWLTETDVTGRDYCMQFTKRPELNVLSLLNQMIATIP